MKRHDALRSELTNNEPHLEKIKAEGKFFFSGGGGYAQKNKKISHYTKIGLAFFGSFGVITSHISSFLVHAFVGYIFTPSEGTPNGIQIFADIFLVAC